MFVKKVVFVEVNTFSNKNAAKLRKFSVFAKFYNNDFYGKIKVFQNEKIIAIKSGKYIFA